MITHKKAKEIILRHTPDDDDDGDDDGVSNDPQTFDLEDYSNRVQKNVEIFRSLFPPEHHGALVEILRRAADEIEKG